MRTHSVASVSALLVTSSGCTTFSSRMSVMVPWALFGVLGMLAGEWALEGRQRQADSL
jgi:hypothetical protein